MRLISSRKSSTAWRAHWKSRVPQAGKRSTLLQPILSPIWLKLAALGLASELRWLKHQKVILVVAFHEVILANQLVSGLAGFTEHNVLVYTVVVSRSIAIDDSNARSGTKRLAQVLKERNRFGHFVVGLKKQCRINAPRRQQWVIWMAKDGLDVVEALAFGALLNILDGLRVDINGVDSSSLRDSAGGTNGKPSGARADVSHALSRSNGQDIHNAVDLQLFVAVSVFKAREITGIGFAGFPVLRWLSCRILVRVCRSGGEFRQAR